MNETQKAVSAAANPQAALLQIAISLDRLHDKLDDFESVPVPVDQWGQWSQQPVSTPPRSDETETTTLSVTYDAAAGESVIELPAVSTERYNERYEFAEKQLDLMTALSGDGHWLDAYGKGGPMWLYLGNRDLVMGYPDHVKRAMVTDVEQDSPKDAQEMARDILKVVASGPDSGVMVGN